MNIYTLLDSACNALVTDSTLQTNAQAWYGQALSVYIDQDRDNPPSGDDGGDAPSIQLHSPFKSASEDNRDVTGGFRLLITVADPDDATRADAAIEPAGTEKLMSIMRRALDVIRADKPSGYVMRYEMETDTISYFPAMLAEVYIEFKAHLTIGQDPFD